MVRGVMGVAVNTAEASLTHPLLTSCCHQPQFLTGPWLGGWGTPDLHEPKWCQIQSGHSALLGHTHASSSPSRSLPHCIPAPCTHCPARDSTRPGAQREKSIAHPRKTLYRESFVLHYCCCLPPTFHFNDSEKTGGVWAIQYSQGAFTHSMLMKSKVNHY